MAEAYNSYQQPVSQEELRKISKPYYEKLDAEVKQRDTFPVGKCCHCRRDVLTCDAIRHYEGGKIAHETCHLLFKDD